MANRPRPPEEMVERLKKFQNGVVFLLYAAMVLRVVGQFVPEVLFFSGAALALFFVLEVFLLSPLGMGAMCLLATIVFLLIPPITKLLTELLLMSLIFLVVGAVLAAVCSGVIITLFYGMIVSVEVFSLTGPLMFALTMTGVTVGTGALAGAGMVAAAEVTGRVSAGSARGRIIKSILGSMLVFLLIGWPCLSWSNGIIGPLACKPVLVMKQVFLDNINYKTPIKKTLFQDEELWIFHAGFYDDCVSNGNNNIVQGGKTLIAENDENIAILVDGIVAVYSHEMDKTYYFGGYLPRKTDAMVMTEDSVVIFGRNRVFYLDAAGSYMWKKTKWTSEFEKLSADEQFERIYELLERQNTSNKNLRFSFEDVAVVAYAQRNGLLLNYNGESHTAWFAREDKKGNVTVYVQTGREQREEKVTFTPTSSGYGLPYMLLDYGYLLYLDGERVQLLNGNGNWEEYDHYTSPDGDLVAMSYMDAGEEGEYIVYLTKAGMFCVDISLLGERTVKRLGEDMPSTRVIGAAGEYMYSFQSDNRPLTKLTFVNDIEYAEETHMELSEEWSGILFYHRMKMTRSNFDPNLAQGGAGT